MGHGALSELLPPEAIRLGVQVADWREAIGACGEALVAAGITTPAYTAEMISTVEQLGPYIVVAPGIALAHARPSPAVLRPGLAWVTLAQPVPFGHRDNDPVVLVVGLAAPDASSHVRALATLAGLLEDPGRRQALLAAPSAEAVREIITAYERSTPGAAGPPAGPRPSRPSAGLRRNSAGGRIGLGRMPSKPSPRRRRSGTSPIRTPGS